MLKRRRSTPAPAWVLIAGRALMAIAVALGLMTVPVLIGRFGYGVRLPSSTLPGVVAGSCPNHGSVEATREVLRPSFPSSFYGVRRFLALGRPFRCPTCGEPVATS